MRLTPTLEIEIVEAARNTMDFDAVEAATGVSYYLLEEWIQRGAKEKIRHPRGVARRVEAIPQRDVQPQPSNHSSEIL